ncbi:TetR/AcrR family transcriptional regulator C-terminal ligand-binding domain-containing protein [Nocardia sp. NPDC051929]|uniref:TetR/AcrR family transcriptional regulator n=1 Tax=unclassified Nocardia TaxID=2637762 RepID=UPI00341F2E56
MTNETSGGTDNAPASTMRRRHTGRRRNEEARQAILHSAIALLTAPHSSTITMDALAKEAGVGVQTIYRWWPSKAAVLADALTNDARDRIPETDTGTTLGDLTAFLAASFRAANSTPVSRALRTLMAAAQHDPHAAEVLRTYTAQRRSVVLAILEHGQRRGELTTDANLPLVVDHAFGFIWYRLLVGHAPLDETAAAEEATYLLRPILNNLRE